MIRPTSLYRSDSQRQPNIQANANNISKESLDCGVVALGCCNSPGWQKLGNKKTFLIILVHIGLIHGAIETYFRISAKQAARYFDYDPVIVDWLLVGNGLFQGGFALIVAYCGNRIHRVAWLGGILMFQSILCLLVIIPTLANHATDNSTIESVEVPILCLERTSQNLVQEQVHSLTTLILLFVLQVGIGLGNIAFFSLGFSYLDDNVHEHESPALLGAAFASKFWGSQIGSLLALIVEQTPFSWWFGWPILSIILFVIGFIASLFPKRMLSTLVRQAANNIVESATSNTNSNASLSNPNNKFIADISLCPSLLRVFTNSILMFNILAAVFIQTAIVNFSRHESAYLQSRFFLPTSESDGLNNEWTSRFVISLLKPPMIALSILVAGLIIAKANPSPRKLVSWNIFAALLVVAFFVGSIFLDCNNTDIAGAHRNTIIQPQCAHDCLCPTNVPFTPVCPENSPHTFFSPCHAGCTSETFINDLRVFTNCSCAIDTVVSMPNTIATEGACGSSDCQLYWIAFQSMTVLSAALLGSTLIGKLIISIRSVLPQDKSMALSLELCIAGILIHIPGKISYRIIANYTCQYWGSDQDRCLLHQSPAFGDILNITTAGLILVGVLFEIIVFFLVKDLPLYGDDPSEDVYRPIPLQTFNSNPENFNNTSTNNNDRSLIVESPEPTSSTPFLSEDRPLFNTIQNSQPTPQNYPGDITYAMIDHSNRAQNASDDNLDFRLQTPNNNGEPSSPLSSISPTRFASPTQGRSRRAISPETNF